jgi:hypothetical protein
MNTTMLSRAARLSNQDLVARMNDLARTEQEATATLIAHLAVFEERHLHLVEGYSSLFAYCTQVLHLSEYAAYGRIAAVRAGRRFPIILEMLSAGAVNLTTVTLLAPHLTSDNYRAILEAATHKSRREVEELVAQPRPELPVPSTVRKLPDASMAIVSAVPLVAEPLRSASTVASTTEAPALESGMPGSGALASDGALQLPALPTTPATVPLPARRAVVEPLAPQQYRVQFTASGETYEKLRLAQDLLRHQIPDGDVGQIMDRALSMLLEVLAKQKFAATERPRERQTPESTKERQAGERNEGTHSRHIPAEVKRRVWLRDGGRCAFVAPNGRRCTERAFVEFHHKKPYAVGGEATQENIELRCRAHNGYEAELFFGWGEPAMVRDVAPAYGAMSPPSPSGPVHTNSVRTEFVSVSQRLATKDGNAPAVHRQGRAIEAAIVGVHRQPGRLDHGDQLGKRVDPYGMATLPAAAVRFDKRHAYVIPAREEVEM